MTRDEQLADIQATIDRMNATTAARAEFKMTSKVDTIAIFVDTEVLPDGSAPIRLSRSIRVF